VGSLVIGNVIQQANIDVDEAGTEAAAATAIGFDVSGGCSRV
jgi:serine protease inhibitor